MCDPLFIHVGSSRSDSVHVGSSRSDGVRVRSLADRAFPNVFAGSFFTFPWHFLQSSLSVSLEVGIFIQKTATSDLALQLKLPGAH